jgi:hypothetical protein
MFIYAHADLAQNYSVGLQFCLQVVLPGRKIIFSYPAW